MPRGRDVYYLINTFIRGKGAVPTMCLSKIMKTTSLVFVYRSHRNSLEAVKRRGGGLPPFEVKFLTTMFPFLP